ncbi:hypothetical protein F5J12DRAFT_907046 [Pisolithus orientalis]|uniref:uncharacterized protein n=1 Tax=Pisolithus orientalis TaxID=936130 RepID=UPI0022257131|nr:uncharacterized protein F5J12DRAFT_907046 [Pisolithus orientalis]KAI5996611.1 hypothetical protein F5J12DRAFT_907046 [Pisolithus orientalis]
MLLVFCDGTGADGTLTGTEVHAPRQFATNVLRLCNGDKPKRQIVLYLSGVGSESDFNGNFAGTALLLHAYAFIAQNFEVGDEICIFGCVGVWDTVDAVYKFPLTPIKDTLGITDFSLPASIENRDRFSPTLWEMPKGGWRDNQVWFPGSHCDVGGGYEKHDLSDLALFWMVDWLVTREKSSPSSTSIPQFIEKIAQPQPDPWGAAQPGQWICGVGWRLEAIHSTFRHACKVVRSSQAWCSTRASFMPPRRLTRPQYMLTLDTLKQAFGTSWKPTIAPLNEFEQYCKDKWGKQSKRKANRNVHITVFFRALFTECVDFLCL